MFVACSVFFAFRESPKKTERFPGGGFIVLVGYTLMLKNSDLQYLDAMFPCSDSLFGTGKNCLLLHLVASRRYSSSDELMHSGID